ncbi:MAG: tandem-95 repeat protein, partial [Deltaproteobacteria bacterium]
MVAGSRATRRGVRGADSAQRAARREGRRPRASLLAALGLLAALAGAGCEASSSGKTSCLSDIDCEPWQGCSAEGVCVSGDDECRATDECPRLAPAACASADVTCRGGQCRYDLDCLSLGGLVTGLEGRGLTIQNGGEQVVLDGPAAFQFTSLYGHSDSYEVTIVKQPTNPGQVCIVTGGFGRFNVSDVADVRVACSFLQEDRDGDGVCDGATLADGCFNFLDNCPEVSNPTQTDSDRDDVGDACDKCTDRDGDGYGRPGLDQSGCPSAGDDCDDDEASSHPDQIERCGDEIDNDCNGETDEAGCQKPYVAPHAVADSYLFDEDQPVVDLEVLKNDTVWDDPSAALVITGTTAPSANGTVVIAPGGGSLRYTPRPDYNGEETFAYSVSDGAGGLSSATVTISLRAVNDPPTANPDSFTLPEDTPVATLDVLGNDSAAPDDGEPLSLVAIGQTSAGGTAQLLLGGNVQYRPAKDFVGVETFIYILSDGRENSTAVGQVTITITPVNDVPFLVTSLADQVVSEDAEWSWTVPEGVFGDVDLGDILTLSATLPDGAPLPGWLSFDVGDRTLSGVPTNDDVGQLLVDIRATDLGGASVGDVFQLTVVNTNDAPTVAAALSPQTAVEGTPWTFVVPATTFADVDAGDTMTYRATRGDGTSLPAWLTFDRTTRTFSGTPRNADVGPVLLAVIATDREGATVIAPFDLLVRNINQTPTLAHPLADREAIEDAPFSFVVPSDTFTDPDPGDETLTFSARRADGSALPAWLSFSPAIHAFTGTPRNADVGVFSVAVIATDSAGATASDVFQLTVRNTNDPPTVAVPLTNRSVNEGVSFSWSLPAATFSDPDVGDTLSFSASGPGGAALPAWLGFDVAQGLLQGLPGNAAVGDHTVVITARDVAGAAVSASFVLHVVNVNAAPVVAVPLPDVAATEDEAFTRVVPVGTFFDEDPGDALHLSAALTAGGALPGWLDFDPTTGTFSGTPTNDDVGTLVVGVTATDLAGASVTDLFTLTVANTNDPPQVAAAIAARTSPEDVALTWVLPAAAFSDVDRGDVLTWSVALADGGALPGWLDFDPDARLLAGTPTNDAVGVATLRVTVTDLAGASAHTDVDLTIQNVNDPPQVLGTLDTAAATEDAAFSWVLPAGVVVDVDPGDTLAFSATRADGGPLPGWLAFDPAARKLSGTPRNADVGTVVLTLKAVDVAGATASVTLPITVVNTNDHPVVVTPIADRTVTARSGFAFFIPPSAFADPDVGDTLSYFVTLDGEDGLPGFVTFDAPERVFFGTPADADVGDYALRITATDQGGLAVASVFHLIVAPAPAGDLVVAHPIIDQQATEEVELTLVLAADTFTGGQPPITLAADRSDGDPLPSWLSFDPASRTFSGTPGNDDVGTLLVRVTATDTADNRLADVFAIEVLGQNDAPEVVTPLPGQVALEGDPFVLAVPDGTFVDVDAGDVLTLTAFVLVDGQPVALPTWLTFFGGTGLFVGTPDNDAVGDLTVRLVATDLEGATAHTDFALHVNDANAPPTLTAPFGQIPATEDAELSWALPATAFVDPDPNDVLTYTADRPDGDPLPSWLTFDPAARTLVGIPRNEDVGVLSVRLTATDRAGAAASGLLRVAVANTNDPPEAVGSVPALHAAQGIPFSAVLSTTIFTDPDPNDVLTWSLTAEAADGGALAMPAWLEAAAGPPVVLAGTPGNADVGTLRLRVRVTDASGASASQLVQVEVAQVNDPPRLAALVGDREAVEDVAFALALPAGTFTDPDLDDTLTLSAERADGAPLPGWLAFDATTATLAGTPTNEDVGAVGLRVIATDAAGATASDVFTLTVLNVNDPPLVVETPDPQVATEGVGFAWVIPGATFFDPDPGEVLTWTVTQAGGAPLPAWLAFDAGALLVAGTPGDGDAGTLTLRVTVTDLALAAASVEVELTVTAVNDPPRVAIPLPDREATEDEAFTFTIAAGSFVDPDVDDTVVLTAHALDGGPLPGWLAFDGVTFSGTPTNADVGTLAVEVTATDAAGEHASDVFLVTVANVNDAPQVAGSVDDQQASVGATWAYVLPAGLFVEVDPGDTVTLGAARASGEALPAWLTFYPASGLFLGTPGTFDVGALTVRVTATDGAGATAAVDFPLTVVGDAVTPVADTRAPRVLSHEPPDGAVMARSERVLLRFDEPIAPATLAAGAQVFDVAAEPVPGTWEAVDGAWVFAPTSALGAGDYTVFVGAGVTDLAGNGLDEAGSDNAFTFEVAPAFASPAWRAATPHVPARVLDVAVATSGSDLTALWLEGRGDNALHLAYRRSVNGGASWGA